MVFRPGRSARSLVKVAIVAEVDPGDHDVLRAHINKALLHVLEQYLHHTTTLESNCHTYIFEYDRQRALIRLRHRLRKLKLWVLDLILKLENQNFKKFVC